MSIYRLKGTAGTVINQSFDLKECLIIGEQEAHDIQIPEQGLAAGTVTVTLEADGSVVLRVLAPEAEVTVNGVTVRECALGGGDEIRIGQSRLMMQAPGLRPQRVLTEEATRARRPLWPWGLALALLAGGAALAWQMGWFAPLLG